MPGDKKPNRNSDPRNDELILHFRRNNADKRNDSEPDPDFDPVLLGTISEKLRDKMQSERDQKKPLEAAKKLDIEKPVETYRDSMSESEELKERRRMLAASAPEDEDDERRCCGCLRRKKKPPIDSSLEDNLHVHHTYESTNVQKRHK